MEIKGKLNQSINVIEIFKNKIVQIILNIILGISTASLTLILLDNKGYEVLNFLLPLVSFIIVEFVAFKYRLWKNLYGEGIGKIRLIVSVILGVFTTYNLFLNMPTYTNVNKLSVFVLLAIPSIIVFLYWFYGKLVYYIKKYIKTIDKVEKYYLIIAGIILILFTSIINSKTTLFSYGILNEKYYDYDVYYTENIDKNDSSILNKINNLYMTNNYDIVYTSDSPILLEFDVFSNVTAKENDYKNPLFGVFSIPFSIIPKAISLIIPVNNIYPTLLSIVQGLLIFIAFTLLARLMKIKGLLKILFLIIITVAFPTILFLISTEQYAFSVFYLIVFIYMAINKIKDKDMAYIMATGSTITTGILFPLLLEKGNIRQGIKNIFFTFLKCMAIFIISARIVLFAPNQMTDSSNGISQYSSFAKVQNLNAFTNFTYNVLYGSSFREENSTFTTKSLVTNNYKVGFKADRPSIRPIDTVRINVFGIVILLLTVIGFILNRKDKLMQICFGWVVFSFVLLAIMGWGIPEDGLILYSFYFSWAYICLIFKGIEKILNKVPKIRNTVYVLSALSMAIINANIIIKMIEFGIRYYS